MKEGTRRRWPRNAVRTGLFLFTIAILVFAAMYVRGTGTETVAGGPVPPIVPGDHIQGERTAPVQLIVYTDMECPHCKALHLSTIPRLLSEFGTSTYVIAYRHFPLASHLRAPLEAAATECAARYGEKYFWLYVEQIFRETKSNDALEPARLPEIADELGLPKSAFERCLERPDRMERVLHDISEALRADVAITPTIFVGRGNEMIRVKGNSYAQLSSATELLLSE